MKTRWLWLGIVVAFLGCRDPRVDGGWVRSSAPDVTVALGSFELAWTDGDRPRLTVSRRGQQEWSSLAGEAFVTAARGIETVREQRGMFTVTDAITGTCEGQWVESVESGALTVTFEGALSCDGERVPYRLEFATTASDGTLRFELQLAPGWNRGGLIYRSSPEERFFGFGEQFTYFDLKGARVPILISEQGIGRGAFPITVGADLTAGAGGDWHTTYAAIPHYLTSELRSVSLENTEYSEFDLTRADRVGVRVFSSRLAGSLHAGTTPLALIAEYTAAAGRMRRLPDWILSGAIVGVQGGTTRVREVRDRLLAAGTPVSALWIQDWVGQRVTSFGKQLWWNWELDHDRYPGWAELVAENRALGIRTMTYISPFLTPVAGVKPNVRRDLFSEAKAAGYLVLDPTGEPYLVPNTDFSAGIVDLTSAAARGWYETVLRDEVLGVGADGWMADFGEALPYDAVLANGDPKALHNAFPVAWAEVNRAAVNASDAPDEKVFFMRAAFTRSPGAATLFWEGDQLVSWDEHDGIKSAVTGLLSGGLSGLALNHSDIGGYTAIRNPLQSHVRTPELLMRWAELSAFTTVFRTHEGNRPDDNHQVTSSDETTAHFARAAKLYAAWEFYRRVLVDEAATTGAPVVRHLFLHFPDDPRVRALRSEEFLVGEELLVAPVLDPGKTMVDAYLPAGEWEHLWSGARFEGPRDVRVAAPLGQPAVFFRPGRPFAAQFQERLTAAGLLPTP